MNPKYIRVDGVDSIQMDQDYVNRLVLVNLRVVQRAKNVLTS